MKTDYKSTAPTVYLQQIFFGLQQSCKVMWSRSLVPLDVLPISPLVLVPGQPTFMLISPPFRQGQTRHHLNLLCRTHVMSNTKPCNDYVIHRILTGIEINRNLVWSCSFIDSSPFTPILTPFCHHV